MGTVLPGYVSTLDEDIRQWFISKYIIGEAGHLLSHRRRNRNLLAQADDIVNKTDGRRLSIEMEQTAEGLHRAKRKAEIEARDAAKEAAREKRKEAWKAERRAREARRRKKK